MTLLDWVRFIAEGYRTVARAAVVTAVIVVAAALLAKRTYIGRATVTPVGATGGASQLAGLAAQFGVVVPSGSPLGPEFYRELILGREMRRRVARQITMTPVPAGELTASELFGVDLEGSPRGLEELALVLGDHVRAEVSPLSGIISFGVRTKSAYWSGTIAQVFVAELESFDLDRRRSQASHEEEFVATRLREARDTLSAAEARLADFRRQNRSFEAAPGLVIEFEQRQREVMLAQTLYTSLATALQQARIESDRDTPVLTVLERPTIPVLPERRFLALKGALALIFGAVIGLLIRAAPLVLATCDALLGPDGRRALVRDLMRPWVLFYRRAGR